MLQVTHKVIREGLTNKHLWYANNVLSSRARSWDGGNKEIGLS